MKKTLLSALVAVLGFTTQATAQSSMLATLNHEGTISTFYGPSALYEAHVAAESGDVITLSRGTFTSTDITKAITLRGAGMDIDTLTGAEPTIITGNFNINLADTETNRLTIEGIYHNHSIYYKGTLTNAMFLKSRFKSISFISTEMSLKNSSFIHCKIAYSLFIGDNSSVSCINSAIEEPRGHSSISSNFDFQNCVINFRSNGSQDLVKSSTYKNCLINTRNSSSLASSCMAYNCIGISSSNIFGNIPNPTNTYISDIQTVFKTYTGQSLEKLDGENFELTDEAKTKYLGTDGTEVGIHGGILPFDRTPSNPQITKCNVASKSTADGKLSVDIEVKAAE